jgi:hypothetical protein
MISKVTLNYYFPAQNALPSFRAKSYNSARTNNSTIQKVSWLLSKNKGHRQLGKGTGIIP